MSSFYVKNFARKKALKIIFTGEDKKVKIHWVIPENENVKINNLSYRITPEKVFLHQNIPTIFVTSRDAEPLNPLEKTQVIFSASDYNTAISSKVGADIFTASTKGGMKELAVLFGIITVLAVGYLIWQFNGLQTLVENFINSQSGGV